MKKTALEPMVIMALMLSFLFYGIHVQPGESQFFETILIKADGNVEGTNKVQPDGNIYSFTSNIEGSIAVEGNNVVLNGAGFTLRGEIIINGNDVKVRELKIVALDTAIEINGSRCKILNNDIQAERRGIQIRDSDSNIISSNKITATIEAGITFEHSSNNEITENNITSSIMMGGVDLSNSNHNTFSRNTIHFVSLYDSSYNIFDQNTLPQGITIRKKSNYNKITKNSITDFNELNETNFLSSGSIYLESCECNLISSNTIVNSGGIFLSTSSKNVLRNNRVESTDIGFEVSGSPQPKLSSFINDIDTSNTINGKKIYYLINKSDLSINPSTYPNIGYLALVNCTRMIIENTHFITQGIMLAWTTDSQITNNDISNNYGDGVILNYASNNKITKNIISANSGPGTRLTDLINANSGAGIKLSYSDQNHVSGNHITRNKIGIYLLLSADNNTITENNISDQEIGINFHTSSSNLIYHNNFINNTEQIKDASWGHPQFPRVPLPSENIWDNGYASGGNYWNNYANLYPEAEELDSSGIYNMPYVVDEENQDRYPLLNPFYIPLVQVPEAPDGNTQKMPTKEQFLTTLVVTSVITIAVICVVLFVYFKKRKR